VDSALVLIPARNEAAQIAKVVRGCLEAGAREVWVLDDASRDATTEEAHSAGALVWSFLKPMGKTGALRAALGKLPHHVKWVFFLDGDGQHPPSAMPKFWEQRHDADCLIGDRCADDRRMPWIRRATNRAMSTFLNRIAQPLVPVPDTQCGMRLVRRWLFQGWLPRGRHFEFETELFLHAATNGARFANVPLPAVYAGEQSKIFWPRDALRFGACVARHLVFPPNPLRPPSCSTLRSGSQ
jgi:glycosyltransferase involved in cell wall biosynthesis